MNCAPVQSPGQRGAVGGGSFWSLMAVMECYSTGKFALAQRQTVSIM